MADYCDLAPGHPFHGPYHDSEYGFPLTDESLLFERLSLEIFQAGLSWLIVLKKRPALIAAFDVFDVDRVSGYGEADIARLAGDTGIIRNRRKIIATIANAVRIRAMRGSDGGFARWLSIHHPRPVDQWVRLFRANFSFTGPEVVREFLMSVGYLKGAHREDCPAFARIAALTPPWRQE